MFLFPPCPAWTMSSCLILKDDYFGDVCGQAILWGKVHGMTAAVKSQVFWWFIMRAVQILTYWPNKSLKAFIFSWSEMIYLSISSTLNFNLNYYFFKLKACSSQKKKLISIFLIFECWKSILAGQEKIWSSYTEENGVNHREMFLHNIFVQATLPGNLSYLILKSIYTERIPLL